MTKLVIALVAGASILGIIAAAGFTAYQRGREAERAETLKRAVELVQERDKLNVKVRNATAPDICRRLGGRMLENGECG